MSLVINSVLNAEHLEPEQAVKRSDLWWWWFSITAKC